MYTFLSGSSHEGLHQFVYQLTSRPIRKFAIFTRQPTENLPGIIISILHTTGVQRQAGQGLTRDGERGETGREGNVEWERKEGGFAGAAVTCHFCKRCLRILYTMLPSRRARLSRSITCNTCHPYSNLNGFSLRFGFKSECWEKHLSLSLLRLYQVTNFTQNSFSCLCTAGTSSIWQRHANNVEGNGGGGGKRPLSGRPQSQPRCAHLF